MKQSLTSSHPWTVYKFGGSSLKDAACFNHVANIVAKARTPKPLAIVVSAVYDTTNKLFQLLELAPKSKTKMQQVLKEIQQLHLDLIMQLASAAHQLTLQEQIRQDIEHIKQCLTQIPYQESTIAQIVGYGEQWSMSILSALLNKQMQPASPLNARSFLTINNTGIGPSINWDQSRQKFSLLLTENVNNLLVITGYLASTDTKQPTLLQRNGSDHSASIIASLLNAQAIHIWTDVDGLYTADPNRIKEAQLINQINYTEAAELAYFGSTVLHPKTMEPAIAQNIPIFIRNTFKQEHPGTKITVQSQEKINHPKTCVKGFSTIENIALINLEGTGMLGVPGIAKRIFHTLQDANISVIMISQASSEHSICFAVHAHDYQLANKRLQAIFAQEIKDHKIASIDINPDCCILAAVGSQMVNTPGVAAKFFSSLAKANINILAIAQGSSERNISVVISNQDATRALQVVHSNFFLSDYTLSIGVIGPGNIGKTFIKQLQDNCQKIKKDFNLDLRLRGITSTKNMLLSSNNLLTTNWSNELANNSSPADFNKFIQHINAEHFSHCLLIDCTSSQKIAEQYQSLLEKNISIITPNKKANSSSLDYFHQLHDEKFKAYYLYESTVGAGLPVISTLKDLLKTGDTLIKIEGIFSGTLSYIFSQLSKGQSFANAVQTAFDQGLTEPDVRDDLSGMDVGRKVLILSRVMGLSLELNNIKIDSLIPAPLQSIDDPQAFLEQLPKHDQQLNQLVQNTIKDNKIIRYVGSVTPQGASAQIKTFTQDHVFSKLQGTDNIIAFYTKRYQQQPLIIQGPGAGPEVTAAGIFADLLRLASYLGATV